ncbi:MAG: type II/IV secretion system protein, partial [Patescibacteria group bacterium]
MKLSNDQLAEILLQEDYVRDTDIREAIQRSDARHTSLTEELVSSGLITKDLLGQAIAEHFGVPYADLNTKIPAKEQVLKIPEDVARAYRVVLFQYEKEGAVIATDTPDEIRGRGPEFGELLGVQGVTFAYSLSEDIDTILNYYRRTLATRFVKIIEAKGRVAPEIVDEILADALLYRASDIHFEPQEGELIIRFRIDGVLQEAGRIDKQYYENILNRIKVLAHLRTDEHMRAQDGAIRHKHDVHTVDLRVSVAPTLDGEKIVIRVLSEYVRNFTLTDLGLSEHDLVFVNEASKKPFGMMLATGPTGSGKTTTMYSILKLLNRPEVNVATIEDPVEYKIPGVNHIQVNSQADITFARGLRAIARQDPDIILVGEIRDQETAEISVNAALTGHLLLSTFHANDAATAIPRLLEMDVEPFLLASTLELIIAQRLVRKLCDACRHSSKSKREVLKGL